MKLLQTFVAVGRQDKATLAQAKSWADLNEYVHTYSKTGVVLMGLSKDSF